MFEERAIRLFRRLALGAVRYPAPLEIEALKEEARRRQRHLEIMRAVIMSYGGSVPKQAAELQGLLGEVVGEEHGYVDAVGFSEMILIAERNFIELVATATDFKAERRKLLRRWVMFSGNFRRLLEWTRQRYFKEDAVGEGPAQGQITERGVWLLGVPKDYHADSQVEPEDGGGGWTIRDTFRKFSQLAKSFRKMQDAVARDSGRLGEKRERLTGLIGGAFGEGLGGVHRIE